MSDETNKDKECVRKDISFLYTFLSDNVREFAFGLSPDEFKDILKTLKGKTSAKLYDKIKNSITNEIMQDIDFTWEETLLPEKYNEITKLTKECNSQKVAWRPKPPHCDNTLNAYHIKFLQEKKQRLEEIVKKQNEVQCQTRNKLEEKRNAVVLQKKKAENLVDNLEKYTDLIKELQENIPDYL